MIEKVVGIAVGGTLAAGLSSLIAQTSHIAGGGVASASPTLADSVAAQGVVTWLLLVAIALLGAAASRPTDHESIVRVALRSVGCGLTAATILFAFDVNPWFVIGAVYVAAVISELIVRGLWTFATQVAVNPLRAIRYYRAGRLAEIEAEADEDDRQRAVESRHRDDELH